MSSPRILMGDIIVATMQINETYFGNVNINNRILTNGKVKKLGHNKFKILPFNGDLISASDEDQINSEGTVEATIDGKKYSGKVIIVDDKNVCVDGKYELTKTVEEPSLEYVKLHQFNLTPPLTRVDREIIEKANDLLDAYTTEKRKFLANFKRKLTSQEKEEINSLILDLSKKLSVLNEAKPN